MSKYLMLIAFSLLIGYNSAAQNTSSCTVMLYNLLGFPNNGCIPNREDTLKIILEEIKPGILMVCEINDPSGVNAILQDALNVTGIGYYKAATYVPNGPSSNNLQNMMFYDSTRFGLVEQNQINTGLRDINHYRVYAKDSGLVSHNDTLFLNLYVGHLKAGPSQASQDDRKQQVDSLRAWSKGFSAGEAHLFAADLNVYDCAEAAYVCLMDSFSCDFEDPIYACGAWHDDNAYAMIHTQSTRCTSFCSGASGGIDDRFDQILVSKNMIDSSCSIQADASSYEAFGNPGNLLDSCLGYPWSHPSLPPRLVSALYYMSDHFPVVMDLDIIFPAIPVALENTEVPVWQVSIQNPVQDQLRVFLTDENPGSLEWTVLTSWGSVAATGTWEFNSGKNLIDIPLPDLASGTYFFRVLDRENRRTEARAFHILR